MTTKTLLTDRLGLTRPIGKLCEEHNVPLDVGYLIADFQIHGRRTAHTYTVKHPQHCEQFILQLHQLCRELKYLGFGK